MIPVPFSTQAYQHRALPLAAQSLVNLYLEQAPPDAKTPVALIGRPGLVDFATIGAGPIRGEHVMAGVLFAVSDDTVYKIDSNGASTNLGIIAGTGAVKMADNGTQLAIVGGEKGYIYDGSTLELIADLDFAGAIDVAYLDGYFVFVSPRSGQFFISALLDGKSYDPLDFATAEAAPDDTIAILVDNRVIWLFGAATIEVWYNSGNADFPFERVSGGIIETGCAAAESMARLDNTIYWLGVSENGGFVVYRIESLKAVRVSTHAIERQIEGYANIADAVAYAYKQEGHSFYVLTFPGNATWVYDALTGLWSEWDSRDAFNTSLSQWRALRHAFAYGKNLVGDFENGKIYELDLDTGNDSGTEIIRVTTGTVIHAQHERMTMKRFELDMQAGVGLTTGQGSDPQAMLDWSDDGGRTWSNEHWRSFGKIGEYKKRSIWNRLGQFRERIMRVTISDPAPVVIFRGLVNPDVGRG